MSWLVSASTDGGRLDMLCHTREAAERFQGALKAACRKTAVWSVTEVAGTDLRRAVDALTAGQQSSKFLEPQHTERKP